MDNAGFAARDVPALGGARRRDQTHPDDGGRGNARRSTAPLTARRRPLRRGDGVVAGADVGRGAGERRGVSVTWGLSNINCQPPRRAYAATLAICPRITTG